MLESTRCEMAAQLKILCNDGIEARKLRRDLGMNQAEFWGRVMVTQSGGSRYESGREMPEQVALLLHLTFASEVNANRLLTELRSGTLNNRILNKKKPA